MLPGLNLHTKRSGATKQDAKGNKEIKRDVGSSKETKSGGEGNARKRNNEWGCPAKIKQQGFHPIAPMLVPNIGNDRQNGNKSNKRCECI